MNKICSSLPSYVEKAASRLNGVINCETIMSSAHLLKDPCELSTLSRLVSKMGLHARCRRSDVCQCVDYLDELAYNLSQPRVMYQYNESCMQMYGPVNGAKLESPYRSKSNINAA